MSELEYGWWRSYGELDSLYEKCPTFSYGFRNEALPDRCVKGYEVLCEEYLTYLSTVSSRVHTGKVKDVVKLIVKNVSRAKYHKSCAVKYVGDKKFWANRVSNPEKLSYRSFVTFVDWLESNKYVMKYKGSGGDGFTNTTNMLVISKDLSELCLGRGSLLATKMEDSLLRKLRGNVIIHTKVNKTQVPRAVLIEERDQVEQIEDVLEAYNRSLEHAEISIGGHLIPELHFRRIFNEDLSKGGRYYDQGEVLSKGKGERSTTLIDGLPTVSLDFKHLHPALCYEMEGLLLGEKDPYGVDVVFNQDYTALAKWMTEWGIIDKPNTSRALAKTALLCMINATSKVSCMAAIANEIRKDKNKRKLSQRKFVGVSEVGVKKLVDDLIKHNLPISKYINSGYGVVLQNLDSSMIEYCIKVFTFEGEVLIPVHDAIIVREDLKNHCLDTMEDSYGYVMKTKMNCRIEEE